ncbi:hypothetical protein ABZT06_11580 [Streptomyces sp. NPDC005483]
MNTVALVGAKGRGRLGVALGAVGLAAIEAAVPADVGLLTAMLDGER